MTNRDEVLRLAEQAGLGKKLDDGMWAEYFASAARLERFAALLSHTAPQAEPASAPAVSERAFDKLTGAFYREHQRLPSLPEIFAFAHRAGAAEALTLTEPAKTQKCAVCGSGAIDGGKIEEIVAPAQPDLYSQIMNLRCTPCCNDPHNEQIAYRKGHRDARHEAAELVAAPAQDGWHEVDRLLKTVKYLIGIAERGDGRAMRDDETTEQFVLGYVKRLESKLSTARAAGFEQCKEMANVYLLKQAAHHWLRRDQSAHAQYIANAARAFAEDLSATQHPEQPAECTNGCPPQQVCDFCQGTGGVDEPAAPVQDGETVEAMQVKYGMMKTACETEIEILKNQLSTARAAGFEQCKEMAAKRLDEVGATLQTDGRSTDYWMGVGAMVEAGEIAIRALQCPEQLAEANNYHDAYRGARDDMQEWKRRALEAEEACRKMTAALNAENGPTFMGEPAAQSPDKDAERYRTLRSLLSVECAEAEAVVEQVLMQMFPGNEERRPTPEELDAVIDAVGVALAQRAGKEAKL